MPEYIHRSALNVSAETLYSWHASEGALDRLLPPWQSIEVVDHEGIREGDRAVIKMKVGPVTVRWVARHGEHIEGRQFQDTQEQGPFGEWIHTHRFLDGEDTGSVLEDAVLYDPPLGALGSIAGRRVRGELRQMFRFRHRRTREDLARHARYADRPRLKVAITGATGLVGGRLAAFLNTGGHSVLPMVRRVSGLNEARWSTAEGLLEPEKFAGPESPDAVVHLAGKSLSDLPWSDARKQAFWESRVDGTTNLCRTLAALPTPPKTLICASAIGFYGDRGAEPINEESARGEGFLAELCEAWEAACAPAREAGIRVVNLRIGVVLTAAGGALEQMLLPFQMGLGGPMGGGRQMMSWVSLDDILGAIQHCLFEDISGPVNATAPTPVSQRALAKTLGRVLRRPALLPAPGAALRLVLGREAADEMLLGGARVMPSQLSESGFEFFYPDLEDCLRMELGRLMS